MRSPYVRWVAFLALISCSFVVAARCQLEELGKLPIIVQSQRPAVTTKINGAKARFLLDTGALYSTISQAAAAERGLPVHAVPRYDFLAAGIGGAGRARLVTVSHFSFLGVPLSHVQFLVTHDHSQGGADGSLGQNLLHFSDVEYDFSRGVVEFIRPVGCDGRPLAYWAVHTPYSTIKLMHTGRVRSRIISYAKVNGHRLSVLFDTGATDSVLSLRVARRIGITTHSPGVKFLGRIRLIRRRPVEVWSAPIDAFQIGGEKVGHTHVLIANINIRLRVGEFHDVSRRAGLILGDDFFRSHRILVAYDQRRLYFTYNGGPMFDVTPVRSAQDGRPPPVPGRR